MTMTTEALIQILELLGGVALLVLFFRYPWQSVLVDMTRQRLFEIRDDIFLYAADGQIEFDSKLYSQIRYRLNSSIRYCHKAKFSTLFSVIAAEDANRDIERQEKSLLEIISAIEDAELRNKLEEKAMEANFSMVALIILRSPFLLILSTLLMPFMLMRELLSGHIKKFILIVMGVIEKDIGYEDHKEVKV